MSSSLTPKQRRFVAEYLKDGNGTQAAIRAGYSKKTSGSQAFDLLKKPEIQSVVGGRLEKLDLKAEDVLRELRSIGFANPDAQDAPQAHDELEPGPFGGALERHRGASLRYEHKLKALELLGKHLKLFVERHEHALDTVTLEQLVLAAAVRK